MKPRSILALALSCAGLAACTAQQMESLGASGPVPAAGLVGRYALTRYNGQPLPTPVASDQLPDGVCPNGRLDGAEAIAGFVVLGAGGTATVGGTTRVTCSDAPDQRSTRDIETMYRGRYTVLNHRVRVRLDAGSSQTFAYDSALGTLAQDVPRGRAEWRIEAPGAAHALLPPQRTSPPSGGPGELQHRTLELLGQSSGSSDGEAYDCRADPRLHRIPAADTAGLGARIATAFPGYRLATEAEVGCRFDAERHGPAHLAYPDRGTGRAWWIWPADFDGDGREDRLVMLSSTTDEWQGQLGVLFATGVSALVTSEVGHPVRLLPKGEAVSACVPEANDEADGLALAAAAVELDLNVYYWRNNRFDGFYTGC